MISDNLVVVGIHYLKNGEKLVYNTNAKKMRSNIEEGEEGVEEKKGIQKPGFLREKKK